MSEINLAVIDASQGPQLLSTGAIDIAMSGAAMTPHRAMEVEFTNPYLEETVAFVVRDHRRNEFMNRESLDKLKGIRLALPSNLPRLREWAEPMLTDPQIESVDSPNDFFSGAEASSSPARQKNLTDVNRKESSEHGMSW